MQYKKCVICHFNGSFGDQKLMVGRCNTRPVAFPIKAQPPRYDQKVKPQSSALITNHCSLHLYLIHYNILLLLMHCFPYLESYSNGFLKTTDLLFSTHVSDSIYPTSFISILCSVSEISDTL